MKPIEPVNEAALEWQPMGHGERFAMLRKQLGHAAGGLELGCSLVEVPPGKRSVPFHAHLGNEEALYVLAGEGKLRLPDREVPLRPGDYVALPAGHESAHQVINSSGATLRFLALSTMRFPEIVVYPDSKKVYAIAGPTGAQKEDRTFSAIYPIDAQVDYWVGED